MWLELVTKMGETDVFPYCDDFHVGRIEFHSIAKSSQKPKLGHSFLYRGILGGPISRPGY
jgi:hypothetical protein